MQVKLQHKKYQTYNLFINNLKKHVLILVVLNKNKKYI